MSDTTRLRDMTYHERFCIVHRSTYYAEESQRCLWDYQAGARPGRGECQQVDATITWPQADGGK